MYMAYTVELHERFSCLELERYSKLVCIKLDIFKLHASELLRRNVTREIIMSFGVHSNGWPENLDL